MTLTNMQLSLTQIPTAEVFKSDCINRPVAVFLSNLARQNFYKYSGNNLHKNNVLALSRIFSVHVPSLTVRVLIRVSFHKFSVCQFWESLWIPSNRAFTYLRKS